LADQPRVLTRAGGTHTLNNVTADKLDYRTLGSSYQREDEQMNEFTTDVLYTSPSIVQRPETQHAVHFGINSHRNSSRVLQKPIVPIVLITQKEEGAKVAEKSPFARQSGCEEEKNTQMADFASAVRKIANN